MDEKTAKLTEMLRESSSIVFFGGAGVSTASDIPDFRSAKGIFSKKLNTQLTPEQLVSHTFYVRYPEEFYDFYKRYLLYPQAKPNDCHTALAKLEEMGKLKAVVTQNIDGLHQAAGSRVVYELHGSVLRNYCTECGSFYPMEFVHDAEGVPHCEKCGGRIKPDVVLYEEGLDQTILSKAVNAIARADMLIIGGTSLVVYPAAGLINYFRGKHLVLINRTVTPADKDAELVINDDIAKVMKESVDALSA